MSLQREFTGINIQWPISDLILNGEKVIETRTYPIPKKYIDKPLAFIETPGPGGHFQARIRAIICFSESFAYECENDFYSDVELHKVNPESKWRWVDEKPKWGWPIRYCTVFSEPCSAPSKKGIIFTSRCFVPSTFI